MGWHEAASDHSEAGEPAAREVTKTKVRAALGATGVAALGSRTIEGLASDATIGTIAGDLGPTAPSRGQSPAVQRG